MVVGALVLVVGGDVSVVLVVVDVVLGDVEVVVAAVSLPQADTTRDTTIAPRRALHVRSTG